MRMRVGQSSLDAGLDPDWFGRDERLERIRDAVDWEGVSRLLSGVHDASEGRPAFPPVVMARVLLLKHWLGASDEHMSRSLRTDVSHMRFAGLGKDRPGPSAATIGRFHSLLAERGLAEAMFHEINRQLEDGGMVLKEGTIADSTIVAAATRRTGPGDEAGDPDAAPSNPGSRRQGCKLHIGMDEESQIVRKARVVQASENDLTEPEKMIVGDEEAFYTDRGYSSAGLSERLAEMGIKDRTMRRTNKHDGPLVRWEKRRNELISALRAPVESVFGTCKRSLGMRRARYVGMRKVAAELHFKLMAYNLIRFAPVRSTAGWTFRPLKRRLSPE